MIETKGSTQYLSDNVEVGAYTYVGERTTLQNVVIGKFCSIASEVRIGTGKHPTNEFISTYPAFFAEKNIGCNVSFVDKQLYDEFENILIGNDVWIGTRAIILDGVTIGNGAIIGAGAVVTKDVSAYSIVGGVPAKIIKYRFSDNEISLLEKFKWWEKDINWVIKNSSYFKSNEFFEKLISKSFINEYEERSDMEVEDFISIKNSKNRSHVDERKLDLAKDFGNLYEHINQLKLTNYSYILYGNGKIAKTIYALMPERIGGYVDVLDKEHHPTNLKNLKFDKIIITVLGRETEITQVLLNDYDISLDKIIILEV